METYKNDLIKLGLNANQALVYELLIKNGKIRASRLAGLVGKALSRPMIYALLDELISAGLAEKEEMEGVARFSPAHPSSLQNFVERERARADAQSVLASALIPKIVSDYNLTSAKPGVRFYEGKEGFARILNDTLTSKSEVLQYADIEVIETRFKKESDDYVMKRGDLDIKKRLIVIDSPFTRKLYASLNEKAVSHVRAIEKSETPFDVTMYIYDGKVSYTTLIQEKIIAVIIEDISIYNMHRHLFDVLYKKAIPILP